MLLLANSLLLGTLYLYMEGKVLIDHLHFSITFSIIILFTLLHFCGIVLNLIMMEYSFSKTTPCF